MHNRILVQTRDGIRCEEVLEWTALVVLAALAAEPETIEELADAIGRYEPESTLFLDREPSQELDAALPVSHPWCLIDLVGRTVMAGNGFELPKLRDAFQADEDDEVRGFPVVWLDWPESWLFAEAVDGWREIVSQRITAALNEPHRDARAVLFGDSLTTFLAERVLAAPAEKELEDEEARYDLTRSIHADWLMTARHDLGGRTPREALLADQEHLSFDMQHRQQQWSMQGRPPRPLSKESAAFRFGHFGIIETVLYFDLVRVLLAEAWEWRRQQPAGAAAELIDFLGGKRDEWLSMPYEGSDHGMTCNQLIESERRRMPITGDGGHLYDDCPICQELANDDFGPAFLNFDGHHLEMENEFAFSLAKTRAEWEQEQEEYRRFSEEMDRRMAERKESGEDDSVWQSSYVNWDGLGEAGFSTEFMKTALAFPLAELGSRLEDAGALEQRDILNNAFAAFRSAQDHLAVQSAAAELRDRLEDVAAAYPELVSQSADLQSRLDELTRQG